MRKSVAFPLKLRIPAWCHEASITLNGELMRTASGGQVISIDREWSNKDKVTVHLPMEVRTSSWGRNSRTIERGPLVYALKIGERWEKETDQKEGDYFSVYPTGDWNYGLLQNVVKDPSGNLKVNVKPIGDSFRWNLANAPVEIVAPAKRIPGWKEVNGVAHQPVTDRNGEYKGTVDNELTYVTLVPYGFTKVRIVAFPVVK